MKPLEIQNVIEEVTRRVIALSDATFSNSVVDASETNGTVFTMLCDKVISTQQLNELPAGVTVIRVDCKSLITPAAADWLREQQIDVQRVDLPSPAGTPNSINDVNKWICLSMDSTTRGSERFDCIIKATKRCHEAVEKGNRVILVTNSPSVALIALNRNQKLRAIEVRDVNGLQDDVNTTCANVFVVYKKSPQSTRLINQIKLMPQHTSSPPEWL